MPARSAKARPHPPAHRDYYLLAVTSLVLSICVAPAGLILSIVTLIQIHRYKTRGKAFAVAGVIIGLLFTLFCTLFIIWASTWSVFRSNPAQQGFEPIAQYMTHLGATTVCERGDNGRSPSNTTPWHEAHYILPDRPALTRSIKQIAAEQGFSLEEDAELRREEGGSENSDYLIGASSGKTLQVSVDRDSRAYPGCSDNLLYDPALTNVSANEAIVYFVLSYTPVQAQTAFNTSPTILKQYR